MGGSNSTRIEKLNTLNKKLDEKKFTLLTGLKLTCKIIYLKESRKYSMQVSSISNSDGLLSVIGLCSINNCEKMLNIVDHVLSLNTNLKIDEDLICSICLEKFADIALSCGHHFCSDDIRAWSLKNNECPICRREFTLNNEFMKIDLDPCGLKQEIKICKEELLNLIV